MALQVKDLWTIMAVLAGSDGCDCTPVSMRLGDPAQIDLLQLRVAFYTDNGFVRAEAAVSDAIRSAARP